MHKKIYDFDDYQDQAASTAIYPSDKAVEYLALGAASEGGEIAGVVKKFLRDDAGLVTDEFIEKIRKECGDTMWYIAMLHNELGISMHATAIQNIHKLRERQERGVLKGSGDNR